MSMQFNVAIITRISTIKFFAIWIWKYFLFTSMNGLIGAGVSGTNGNLSFVLKRTFELLRPIDDKFLDTLLDWFKYESFIIFVFFPKFNLSNSFDNSARPELFLGDKK